MGCTVEQVQLLPYHTGLAVQAECHAWDPKRDLALLKITAIEALVPASSELVPTFIPVPLATRPPAPREQIVCIGQPGRDDLEANRKKRTKSNLVELSEGTLRGTVPSRSAQQFAD